jgi:hypothetical protein
MDAFSYITKMKRKIMMFSFHLQITNPCENNKDQTMIPLLLSCFHKNKEKRNVVIFSFAYYSQNDVKTRKLSKKHKTWDQTLATIDFGWFLLVLAKS